MENDIENKTFELARTSMPKKDHLHFNDKLICESSYPKFKERLQELKIHFASLEKQKKELSLPLVNKRNVKAMRI